MPSSRIKSTSEEAACSPPPSRINPKNQIAGCKAAGTPYLRSIRSRRSLAIGIPETVGRSAAKLVGLIPRTVSARSSRNGARGKEGKRKEEGKLARERERESTGRPLARHGARSFHGAPPTPVSFVPFRTIPVPAKVSYVRFLLCPASTITQRRGSRLTAAIARIRSGGGRRGGQGVVVVLPRSPLSSFRSVRRVDRRPLPVTIPSFRAISS